MAQGYYVLNSVPVGNPGGALLLKAGELISDPATISAALGAGAILVPNNNQMMVNAAAIVAKYYAKGASADIATKVMMAAFDASGGGLMLRYIAATIAASATLLSQPAMADRPGTIQEAKFICFGQPAAGESVVLQFRKNGTNITGTTITYGNSSTPKTEIVIPSLQGVTFVEGDVLDCVVTYTAGGGPALGTGQNGIFDLWLRTQ